MSAPRPSRRFHPVSAPGFFRTYHVVLHRSPGVPLPDVVQAVRRVTRFAEAEALARMWDAHHRGRAVVTTTHFERAEFLAERLSAGGITVSLEVVLR